jgi:hypothetical protein
MEHDKYEIIRNYLNGRVIFVHIIQTNYDAINHTDSLDPKVRKQLQDIFDVFSMNIGPFSENISSNLCPNMLNRDKTLYLKFSGNENSWAKPIDFEEVVKFIISTIGYFPTQEDEQNKEIEKVKTILNVILPRMGLEVTDFEINIDNSRVTDMEKLGCIKEETFHGACLYWCPYNEDIFAFVRNKGVFKLTPNKSDKKG